MPSRPLSRTDSLPGYRSDASTSPPAYESDEDVSETVANGFRNYALSTASSASSRWTPDSSVVDVSPRPSMETLHFAETTETLHYTETTETLYAETTETGVGEKS
jgi:succinylarginine dihydrolase